MASASGNSPVSKARGCEYRLRISRSQSVLGGGGENQLKRRDGRGRSMGGVTGFVQAAGTSGDGVRKFDLLGVLVFGHQGSD